MLKVKEAIQRVKEQEKADKKLATAQQQMFTEEGEPTKAVERKYQSAVKAQEKLDAQRRKQLLGAKQIDLPFPPVVSETQVSEEVTAEGQGDVFAGMPEGEITRAPAIGTALNDFLKDNRTYLLTLLPKMLLQV